MYTVRVLKSICSWKKINGNIKLMFLKFVTFVETETWIWWKVIVSGRFSKAIKNWKNCSHNFPKVIFEGYEMFVFR